MGVLYICKNNKTKYLLILHEMKNYLFVIMLIILSSNTKAQINVPIDINEGIANSNIVVEHTTFDIGSINNVFDSNYGTLVRSANINPLVITLEFENPLNFTASKLLTTQGDGNWILETADNINDLNNQTGSYVSIINRALQDGVVDSIGFDTQVGTFLRLTLTRTTGDNYVHLNEWQIITEANIDELFFSDTQTNTIVIGGQKKLIVFGHDNNLNINFLLPNDLLIWTSTNTDVATVNSEGVVLGLSTGITTIEAKYDNSISTTKDIEVNPSSIVEEDIDTYLSTPATGYSEEIPVVIIRYLPTLDGINIDVAQTTNYGDLGHITIDDLKDNIDTYDKRTKFALEEGSKFRGYDNSNADPYLGYRVVKYLTVYRQVAISDFPQYEDDLYQVDYNQEFAELNLTNFINDNNVKEVWMWFGEAPRPDWPAYDPAIHGDITEWVSFVESNMSSPTTGDISNSYRYPDDIPIVDHTFVVYNYNFRRIQAESIHNHGHQLECMYNYAAEQQDGTNAMFLENFCGWGPGYSTPPIGRAGDTHHPPNTDVDYDYLNTTLVESDIQDWNPLGGPLTYVNCNTWGDINYNWPGTSQVLDQIQSQWYIYWFQSMPGYNNQIPYNSYEMTNWWQFVADWDLSNNNNIGLYGNYTEADFTTDNLTPSIVETVNFTDLSTNTPTSWLWTFTPSTITYMNGTSADSQHPEVRFDNLGLYTVELTVTNADGYDTETKADYINATNPAPEADFTADNLTPNIIETVNFTDISTNTPISWLWTFTPSTITYMNGTSADSQHPEVRFDNTSYYTVSLTATNDYGFDTETKTDYITVTDPPPDADFVTDNTTPLVDETVIFTDLSTNDPTSWLWTFSPSTVTYMSGTDQNSQTPQVQFDEIGLYTVELTATNAGGSDTEIKTGYINVGGAFAVIVTATPEEICIGNSSQLEAFPSGGSGTYTFLWTSEPPGYNSTDQNPTVFPLVTTAYTIEVNDGNQSIFENVSVTVNPLPDITLGDWPEILCNQQEPPVQLTATPTGGIFNGDAVTPDGLFRPEEAPFGWNIIYYTYENPFGCEAMELDSIMVDNCVGVFKPELKKMNLVTVPNPFTTSTTFQYELEHPERVSLSIYNYSGKQVEIIQENQPQGKQQLTWNADRHSNGIYYFRLQAGDVIANGKMVKVQ